MQTIPKSKHIMLDEKNVGMNLGGSGSYFYLTMYNNKNGGGMTSCFLTRQKVKELATFFKTYLENDS